MCRRACDKRACSFREAVGCFNCGGGHVAGVQKCPVRVRQIEVSRVRGAQKVSHAEAVRKVEDDMC